MEITELNPEIKKSFYAYASDFFKHPKIEDACLVLYEKYQVNANMLMFCCWLAKENYQRLTKDEVKLILKRIKKWASDILHPLVDLSFQLFPFRQTKKFSKPYQLIQECVNNAAAVERSLILEILQHLDKQTGENISNVNFALSNIFRYLEVLQISLHKNDLEKIYRITSNF